MTKLTEHNIRHLRQQIELASGCTVTLQEERDNWTGELLGFFAWANRDWETRPGSRTVATASGMFELETLDRLAEKLGVSTDADIHVIPEIAA